jgi:predicted RNA-binding protein with PIN domain
MDYLIDGHNLIPKLGLRLESLDDEMALIEMIKEFCRLRRAQAEIYFDGGLPGQPAARQFGAVKAFFVRRGLSADAAIENRLAALGRQARNWCVVSSDGRVSAAARAAHAACLSAEEFVSLMQTVHYETISSRRQDPSVSPQEVEEWLTLFRSRPPGH